MLELLFWFIGLHTAHTPRSPPYYLTVLREQACGWITEEVAEHKTRGKYQLARVDGRKWNIWTDEWRFYWIKSHTVHHRTLHPATHTHTHIHTHLSILWVGYIWRSRGLVLCVVQYEALWLANKLLLFEVNSQNALDGNKTDTALKINTSFI